MNDEIKNPLEIQMYGIWIKHKGWLRANNERGKEFATYSLDVAKQVAKNIGGVVRYIDQSLIDLEPEFLHKERKSLWVTLQNWLEHRSSTSASSRTTSNS